MFNKASLMNVGFVKASAFADFDCFIFHDVDLLPQDDRNFYVCSPQPRHVGSYLKKWNYRFVTLLSSAFIARLHTKLRGARYCLFIRLTHCGIVSKRLDISSKMLSISLAVLPSLILFTEVRCLLTGIFMRLSIGAPLSVAARPSVCPSEPHVTPIFSKWQSRRNF